MHVLLRIPLLVAALAALPPATAQGQQVHLGRPLALEAADAPPGGGQPAPAVPELDEESSASQDSSENHPPPATAGAADADANESKALGRPQKLLASARSVTGEGDGLDREKKGGPFGGIRGDALQVISALAIVLGLVFTLRAVLLRGAHRFGGGGRPSGVLEILARYPIARGQHLVLLKVARRILLVHQSGPAMTTLSEMTDPDEVASLLARIEAGSTSPREASRFRSLLGQFTREHEGAAARQNHAGIQDAWADGEVVDLTKRPRRSAGGLLSRPEGRT